MVVIDVFAKIRGVPRSAPPPTKPTAAVGAIKHLSMPTPCRSCSSTTSARQALRTSSPRRQARTTSPEQQTPPSSSNAPEAKPTPSCTSPAATSTRTNTPSPSTPTVASGHSWTVSPKKHQATDTRAAILRYLRTHPASTAAWMAGHIQDRRFKAEPSATGSSFGQGTLCRAEASRSPACHALSGKFCRPGAARRSTPRRGTAARARRRGSATPHGGLPAGRTHAAAAREASRSARTRT
jgi:hypothetical protein